MGESRLTKTDVIERFSRQIRSEGWIIVPAPSDEFEVDVLATMGGVGLFAFVVGELGANGRGAPVVRDTAAAFYKAASLRSAFPFERICVVAAGMAGCHSLSGASFTANAAKIELWFAEYDGSFQRFVDEECSSIDLDFIYSELKRWPQDYFRPIGFGEAELFSNGKSLGEAIVVEDEIDDEQFDLQCLVLEVESGRQTLSFGGFYISRSDTMPGACMVTSYDYSFGNDYPNINAALTAIRRFAPLGKPSRGVAGFRGYVVGYDRFDPDLFGVYLGDHIVVGAKLKSPTAAVDFIRSFIESRRSRITDNERYR